MRIKQAQAEKAVHFHKQRPISAGTVIGVPRSAQDESGNENAGIVAAVVSAAESKPTGTWHKRLYNRIERRSRRITILPKWPAA